MVKLASGLLLLASGLASGLAMASSRLLCGRLASGLGLRRLASRLGVRLQLQVLLRAASMRGPPLQRQCGRLASQARGLGRRRLLLERQVLAP